MILEVAPAFHVEVAPDDLDQAAEAVIETATNHHHSVGEREDIAPHLDARLTFHLRLLKAFIEFSKLGENP